MSCGEHEPDGGERTMSWHADEALLSRYAFGEIDQVTAMSLEAHLTRCASCRSRLPEFVDVTRLHRGWEVVLGAVDAPRRGPLESLLVRMSVADGTARLVAATPSLRASWLAAVTVALGFAVVAAHQVASVKGLLTFLVVAPLLPLAGVAVAYGPGVDPMYEIGVAAPLSSSRLLLLRAAAVLTATVALAGLAGLMLPGPHWAAVAWLLPALGLVLGSLALSTMIEPLRAAAVVGVAWVVAAVVVTVPAANKLVLFSAAGQIVFALLAAGAGLAITRRREAFEQQGSSR
ncbi:MAG: zf-HC2 domain-containing protein [Egibacteraceae bacterium]